MTLGPASVTHSVGARKQRAKEEGEKEEDLESASAHVKEYLCLI